MNLKVVATVTLVYPYFHSFKDRSAFRFPPLGLGYVASYLKQHGVSVDLVDCTFLSHDETLERIRGSDPEIIGVYSMFSMKNNALHMARLLKKNCGLLVAGGHLPTLNPEGFLADFNVVVLGEVEQTMLELVNEAKEGGDFSRVRGIVYNEGGRIKHTPSREFIENLDSIPFPARELFCNEAYQEYYRKKFGYTITSLMSSRGCPFSCDFCSQPTLGNYFRTRSAGNIVEEMKEVHTLGYDRVWFADDCFTLDRKRLIDICNEILRRGVRVGWECLSRVDTINRELAGKMRKAGCVRVFFGIESGNDGVLSLMNKGITVERAEEAVRATKMAGVQVGAFFILGYPGETDRTVLDTLRFASSLPLDYLSFTFPYPIPGTPLYEKVKDRLVVEDQMEPKGLRLIDHELMYRSSFSEAKLKFAILKATVQFILRKYLGAHVYTLIGTPFERLTTIIFKLLP